MIKPKNKRLICEFVDHTCELCRKQFNIAGLDIHRIRRAWQGGTYEHRNIQVLCKKCHKMMHAKENK